MFNTNNNPFYWTSCLRALFSEAINAVQIFDNIANYIHRIPKGKRTIVIGAGKAAAAMARILEEYWPGVLEGIVVTRYGHGVQCNQIKVIEAGHPIPDEASIEAANLILEAVRNLTSDDVVICLLSGGGSALMCAPVDGLTLFEYQRIITQLLKSGASISEINTVRRHISKIKGGKLALACAPARVINFLISDVPGDRVYDIASGPTVGDPTTCKQALCIIKRYDISISYNLYRHLSHNNNETLEINDLYLKRIENYILATPQIALEAAANKARSLGIHPLILSDRIEGEAREVGKFLASIALQIKERNQPIKPPCVVLSGGETTVTVRGEGRGGRNSECMLAMAIALGGEDNIYALAADTDGIDGIEEIAGALITPKTLSTAWSIGMNPHNYLSNNDSHSFFEILNQSLITGPTRTNVNDFRAIIITDTE